MRILIAGDFVPRYRLAPLIESGKYSDVFGGIKPIVDQADYAIVNFESPVCNDNYNPIEKSGPNLKCTAKAVEAIKWAGFKMASLANNHIYDFGGEGLNDTLAACIKHGVDTVGVGQNLAEAQKVFYKEICGKTLAIINCCEHEFSIADVNTSGANPINPIQQYYQIQQAKSKADYVLVIIHGGHEHYQLPSPRMKETYRFFIDAGADAVVNHHQHCYSGYEVYQGKPIFYGLGNFCFDINPPKTNSIWNEGYMVEIKFDASISFELYPCNQCNNNPSVNPITTDLDIKKFYDTIAELNSIINDDTLLMRKHKLWMDSTQKMYRNAFEIYKGRYTKALFNRRLLPSLFNRFNTTLLLNFIDCEAHRERLINLLKQNCHE